jgi:translation initiation factor 1
MSDDKKPFHNPFGALAALRDSLPQVVVPEPTPAEETSRPAKVYARAVVRMERSGRGGKEVTVVEQLGLSPMERPAWLAALKAALGCGGSIEGESLMLQGDHRNRLPAILGARGVKRIIVS